MPEKLRGRPRGELLAAAGVGDPVDQPADAAHAVQADERQRQQRGHDDEELQDLVVDGRRQPAEGDVAEHHGRGHDERQPQRPAQQRLDDGGQQVEVDAGDEDLGGGEAQRVDQVGAGAEPAAHELRDAADLRPVVEGHHHHAQEQHGRDRADPEVVHGAHAELRAVGRHADDLDRAQVGRDERQAGHPRGQRPAGQEEVQAVGHPPARGGADQQHDGEVGGHQQVVDERRVQSQIVHSGLHSGRVMSAASPRARGRRRTRGGHRRPRARSGRRRRR